MINSVNPATGETFAQFSFHSAAEVDATLLASSQTQQLWGRVPIRDRVSLLRRMAALLRKRSDQYALLVTREMGKPIAEARAEIEKCALCCDFYAEKAPEFLAGTTVVAGEPIGEIVYDPLGTVLAIMPWNYPFWQFFRFAAPALAAGNGIVLKHANNVPGCALACEAVARDAGAPEGLVRTLLVDSGRVAAIIADDRIAAVTMTGSTEVGSLVAAQAGSSLKKQVLELGGSDPFVVLEDADIDRAAQVAVKARFINNGQSCVNAKRFIVQASVAERFVGAFLDQVKKLRIGDPLEEGIDIGPMARANLRDTLHDQVERSIAAGSKLLTGGEFLDRPGFYYAPTVLDRVAPGSPAFDEETFGPVAAIVRVATLDDAIGLANQTEFGLGAALWSRDIDNARRIARQIQAGTVSINGMVASDPRLPFGGIKRSGYGRELGSDGIREFTNIKTLWVA